MNRINKRRLEILNDTVEYYKKAPVSRRCRDLHGDACYYHPDTLGKPKSEGCAVGRLLSRKLASQLDAKEIGNVDEIFNTKEMKHNGIAIPKKILNLGENFLKDLQSLHDEDSYWTKRGISEDGKSFEIEIKTNIEIGYYD